MKVLYFNGYGDYDNIYFQEQETDLKSLYEKVKDGMNYIETDDYEGDLYAYEFGNVDEKFIEFVRSKIQDYDVSKSSDFYVIEE